MKKTKHFMARQQQRSIRDWEVNFTWVHGDFSGDDTFFMNNKTCNELLQDTKAQIRGLQRQLCAGGLPCDHKQLLNREICELKRDLHRIEHTRKLKIVCESGIGITCMKSSGRGDATLRKKLKDKWHH
jgi:hypothetical protein